MIESPLALAAAVTAAAALGFWLERRFPWAEKLGAWMVATLLLPRWLGRFYPRPPGEAKAAGSGKVAQGTAGALRRAQPGPRRPARG
ncbi:MAG TPA: hypothetical protein VJG13_00335 [Thermoanaerobaculia bacterium]|nr:hypothetical protein [Thermoanaerobaculia bacterium]